LTGSTWQYLWEFLAVLASIAPLVGLAIWAHVANKSNPARIALIVIFAILSGAEIFAGAGLIFLGGALAAEQRALTVAVSLFLGLGIITTALLFRRVRQVVSRFTPIAPESAVDMAGLIILIHVAGVSFALMIGVDILSIVSQTASNSLSLEVPSLIIQFVQYPILSFFAVGIFINRDFKGAVRRLGLTVPSLRSVGIALGIVVLAYMAGIVINAAMAILQPGELQNLNKLSEELYKSLLNPVGALVVGLTAGIGEEMLFRGAVQPRFGIILTSLLFTSVHLQYGFTIVLLQIFVLALLLGMLRKRAGTTAAMITHIVYNFSGLLLASFGINT
jgi:uncharacterized protein